MTSSSNKKILPPNWIVKTSRQYPTLFYYANVKTGQSTWKHPSLLKDSELKSLTKRKRSKTLHENTSEDVRVMSATSSDSDVGNIDSSLSKKAKSSPSRNEHLTSSRSNIKQAAYQNENQEAENSTADDKSLTGKGKSDGKTLIWKTLEENQESKNSTEDYKAKPIKFTIKKRNILSTSPVTDSTLKKPGTIHPSILLAKKIAARDLQLQKIQDDTKKSTAYDEVQHRKTKDGKEKTLEPSLAATKPHTLESETELRHSIIFRTCRIDKTISKSDVETAKGGERKMKHKKKTLSSLDGEIISRLHKTEKEELLDKDDKKDIHEKKRKENKMYEDFIKHKSKEWRKSRYKSKATECNSSKSEVSRDEEHSKSLSKNEGPEHPKEETLEDNLKGPPAQQVSSLEGAKVCESLEPLPEPLPVDHSITSPKTSAMEIDEEELITEITNFRDSTSYLNLSLNNNLAVSTVQYSSTLIYFVVDTNVLIRDTDFLQQLQSILVDGREAVVVVPYVALQEMDGLKKSASIGQACQAAVKWCNKHFEAQDPRVLGQTYSNYCSLMEKNRKATADDLVRDYCLSLVNEGLDVCLLTNDVNLRNKAIMSRLLAMSAKDLRKKLNINNHLFNPSTSTKFSPANCLINEAPMNVSFTEWDASVSKTHNPKPPHHADLLHNPKPPHHADLLSVRPREDMNTSNQTISEVSNSSASEDSLLHERIRISLCQTLGHILEDVMKEVYEELWLTIVIHKPPWSLEEVFACWEKHWIAVMIERFPSSMKELLLEVHSLLTSTKDDVQKLLKRVQFLYSHFESMKYKKHIIPVHDHSTDAVDMSEASTNTPPHTSSLPEPCQHSALSGVINVEKMIYQVGAHITHFVALVLTAFGIQHELSMIRTCESMTLDNARSSAINLHHVIMSLGTTITKCLNEKTSAALQELGHVLVNFWSEAKLPCPHLPFTECDLRQYIESPSNMPFLEGALKELESLIQQLRQVLTGP